MVVDREMLPQISDRQWQVLELLVLGVSCKEIAARLKIHGNTVDTHRYWMMAKLGVSNVPDLIHFCYASGAIKFPENSGD